MKPSRSGSSDRGPILGFSARVVVAGVFVFSGLEKLVAPPEEFAAVIETYRLLPDFMALLLARVLPWLQLYAGLALAAGYLTRLSAALIGAMLAVFIGALGSTIVRGIPLSDCGCYGEFIHLNPPTAIAVDAVLLALTVLAARSGRRLLALDRWIGAPEMRNL